MEPAERTHESGAYLGGIGTMLSQADVCPSCGEAHPDRGYSFRSRGARECPAVVSGTFPVLARPPVTEPAVAIDLHALPSPLPAAYPGGLPEAPRPAARRAGHEFAIPGFTADYLAQIA